MRVSTHMQLLLSTLLLAALILCASSPEQSTALASGPCPDGLQIHYEWREGTVPPPYHYEYSIDIIASGEGKLRYVPDYPSERAPVWTESFTVDSNSLQQLCSTMAAEGLWTEDWQPMGIPMLGGSSESAKVKGNQKTVTIPSFPAGRQKAQAKAICEAIKSLVPQSIWSRLEAERQKYMEDHARP